MSALPFREKSLIAEAVKNAQAVNLERLKTAIRKYFSEVQNGSYNFNAELSTSGSTPDKRESLLVVLERFDAAVAEHRQLVDRAIELFDREQVDIDVWLQATDVGEKLAGRKKALG